MQKYTLISEPPCIQNRVYCIFSDIFIILVPYHLMPSMTFLFGYFVAITYFLKTSTLRVQIIQDGKLLIFNSKASDPSAVLRRSLGDPFITA